MKDVFKEYEMNDSRDTEVNKLVEDAIEGKRRAVIIIGKARDGSDRPGSRTVTVFFGGDKGSSTESTATAFVYSSSLNGWQSSKLCAKQKFTRLQTLTPVKPGFVGSQGAPPTGSIILTDKDAPDVLKPPAPPRSSTTTTSSSSRSAGGAGAAGSSSSSLSRTESKGPAAMQRELAKSKTPTDAEKLRNFMLEAIDRKEIAFALMFLRDELLGQGRLDDADKAAQLSKAVQRAPTEGGRYNEAWFRSVIAGDSP